MDLLLKNSLYFALTRHTDLVWEIKRGGVTVFKDGETLWEEKFPPDIRAEVPEGDTFLVSCRGYISPYVFRLRKVEGGSIKLATSPLRGELIPLEE